MKRLFIAFTIPPEASEEIDGIQAELRKKNNREPVNWVRDNYHITFAFLGDCDENTEACLRKKLSELENFGPFELQLKRVEAFPDLYRPRVLVVKCRDESGGSLRLHLKLKNLLASCGVLLADRGFKPHITMGRVKGHNVRIQGVDKLEIEPVRFVVDKVTLFASELLPNGPKHTELLTLSLRAKRREA